MNWHLPHMPEPKSPRAQLALILGKFVLVLVIVALVVASIVQQRSQRELQKAQEAARFAHNDGACGMRALTELLVDRTQAALNRPTTRPQDKPGFQFAIQAYQALHDKQITIPRSLDCATLDQP